MSDTPVIKHQLGNISVAVFRREVSRTDGSTFIVNDFAVQKSWKDKEGAWQQASVSLDRDEAPRVIEAIRAAYVDSFAKTGDSEDK